MRRGGRLALLAVFALGPPTAGCAKPPFTQAVRERFGLGDDDMQRIQFFTSEDIVLRREVDAQSKRIEKGGLAISDGIRVEQITIPAHTPGVALRAVGPYVLVGFSSQDRDAALWFGIRDGAPPSDDGTVRYRLLELENTGAENPFVPRWSPGFLVSWNHAQYRVESGREAYLLYQVDESYARELVDRSPPGWRLSDRLPPGQPASRRALPREAPSAAAEAGVED